MTWSDVAIATAFVVGALAGGVAVAHVTRSLLIFLRAQTQPPDEEEEAIREPPTD